MLFLKATAPETIHKIVLTEKLATWFSNCMLNFVTVNVARGWGLCYGACGDLIFQTLVYTLLMKKNAIAKVVKKVKFHEQQSDFAYWQSQPPIARLEALEEIRREYHRWKDGAEPRLQRVYTIVKQTLFVISSYNVPKVFWAIFGCISATFGTFCQLRIKSNDNGVRYLVVGGYAQPHRPVDISPGRGIF